ncbi:MAG: type VII secretion protein EssC [Lachnospiraceae bacterium]|nr:type VII secretion protein EssC [Lachnospiraceae bacterium]
MNLLLTAVFENGFCEIYMPSIDNKTCPVEIRPSVSGYDEDIVLPLEVWDGKWTLKASRQFSIFRQDEQISEAPLQDGLLLNCELKKGKVLFSLTAEQADEGNTSFTKYFVNFKTLPKITIGKDGKNTIQYGNRFVSPAHAEIFVSGNGVVIRDLDSMNGTFVNGRLLKGERPLYYGDIIYIIGLKIVFLGNILAINNPHGECRVQNIKAVDLKSAGVQEDEEIYEESEDYFLRTPRRVRTPDTESFALEKCPPKQEQKVQPLIYTVGPAFTMVIPIALGSMLSMGSGFGVAGIVMSVGAAAIGAVWAVLNVRYQKNENAANENKRVSSYKGYIGNISSEIQKKMDYNRNILEEQMLDSGAAADYGIRGDHHLWEKDAGHKDFLYVRLGKGDIRSYNDVSVAKEQALMEHDPLSDLAAEVSENMRYLKDVPVGVSILDNLVTGIVCRDRSRALNLSNLISVQIAALHPYTQVRTAFVYPMKESDHWNYTHWLPHSWTPDGKLRLLACDDKSVGDVMYFLNGLIRERLEEGGDDKQADSKVLPHYCITIGDWSLVENEPVAKYLLHPTPEMGISVIILADELDKLPASCTAIIRDDSDYQGFYSTDGRFEERCPVAFDVINDDKTEAFARTISNFKLRDTGVSTEIPELLSFLDMYHTSNVESLDIMHKWLENRTYESMKAMIGYKAGNQPLYLDIHEKYHGPHGLVAGTTGSGKSETLQSYILSLAVNYHPHEVAFILIDYKGGGMAQSFIGLPHLAGVITNLGGNAANRALLSINAEIRHRQQVFNDYKVKHIDAYIELYRSGTATEPMPHLLIIADEFAELKKEQPEFVRALVSAARVGRSLGVNLILATQKPSGVVDDEIWSNTRFRLCLRVADKQDSQEMLKRPDAAMITGTGRGYFQVGNNEIFEEFQSGWSGAEYEPDVPFRDEKNARVDIINLVGKSDVPPKKKKKKSDNIAKLTQLDALVKYMSGLAEENAIPPLRKIWLPPLPAAIALEQLKTPEMEAAATAYRLIVPIGLADSPETQSQYTVYADFLNSGNLLVCGSAGAGKTTLLQTIIFGLARNYTAADVNIYIADFSSRTMSVFGTLPTVGGVMFEGDDEAIEETMGILTGALEERRKVFSSKGIGSFKEYVTQERDFPAIIFMIDNFVAFYESYEQYEDLLVQVSREGASYGIYLVFTANTSGDLRSRLRQNFPFGIGLQMADKFEYEAVVGDRTEIIPEGRTPGRGLLKAPAPVEFQTALPLPESMGSSQVQLLRKYFEENKSEFAGEGGVRKVSASMTELKAADFQKRKAVKGLAENLMALGIAQKDETTVTVDMNQEFCYTVSGQFGSGKTGFLKWMALQAKDKGYRVRIFDGEDRELETFAKAQGFGYMFDADGLFDCMEQELQPELLERNGLVADARDAGADIVEAVKDKDRILVLINDMTAFLGCVYNPEYGMDEFIEMALDKGFGHKIYFMAAVTPDDYSDGLRYRAMRIFSNYGRGIHLGGLFEMQSILKFDLSAADRVRTLPAGVAYAVDSKGEPVTLITPKTED